MSDETLDEYRRRLRARTKELASMPYGDQSDGVEGQKSDMRGEGTALVGASLVGENIVEGIKQKKTEAVAQRVADKAMDRARELEKAKFVHQEMWRMIDPADPAFRTYLETKKQKKELADMLHREFTERQIAQFKKNPDIAPDSYKKMAGIREKINRLQDFTLSDLDSKYGLREKFKKKYPKEERLISRWWNPDKQIRSMMGEELATQEKTARKHLSESKKPIGVGQALDDAAKISRKAKYMKYASRLGGLAGLGMMLTDPAEAADPSAWTPMGPSTPIDETPESRAIEAPGSPEFVKERLRRQMMKRRLQRMK